MQSKISSKERQSCIGKHGFCDAMSMQFFYVGYSNKTLKGDFYLKLIKDQMIESLSCAAEILHERDAVNHATNAVSYCMILPRRQNKITQSPLFWRRHFVFVDDAMVGCCVSNFWF